jgi:AcrR family transcriptional regulator
VARKTGIDRHQVLDAAAAIADRDGLASVSLASVAAALGVRSPSLYSHIDGLAGLRRALTRRAALEWGRRLAVAAEGQADPVAALRGIGHAYRGFARQHPGLYASLLPAPLAADDPDSAAAAAAAAGVVARALTGLGVPPDRHIDLIRTLRAILHGFVDLENGHGFGLSDPVDASFEAALDLFVSALRAR